MSWPLRDAGGPALPEPEKRLHGRPLEGLAVPIEEEPLEMAPLIQLPLARVRGDGAEIDAAGLQLAGQFGILA